MAAKFGHLPTRKLKHQLYHNGSDRDGQILDCIQMHLEKHGQNIRIEGRLARKIDEKCKGSDQVNLSQLSN